MNVYNITSENFDILTKSDKIILEKLLKRCLIYRNFNNTETLYHFSCKSINSYIPNVKHLTKLIDSILEKFNIKDKYKPYK